MEASVVQPIGKRRGLKKGQRTSGQFKKGYDPRRGTNGPARSSLLEEVSAAAAAHVADGIEFLADVYKDETKDLKLRIMAVQEILSRGVGTPVSMQIHKQIIESGNGHNGNNGSNGHDMGVIGSSPPAALSDDQLEAVVQNQINTPRLNGARVEDAEFSEVEEA